VRFQISAIVLWIRFVVLGRKLSKGCFFRGKKSRAQRLLDYLWPSAILCSMLRTVFLIFLISSSLQGAGFSPDQKFVVGRLPCAKPWNGRDHGLRQLAWETSKRTSVDASFEPIRVDPTSPDLFKTPFLLWSCQGKISPLDQKGIANVRRFLTLGGFLWIDDPSAGVDSDFDESIKAVLAKVFPAEELKAIAADHVLFKSFFLIKRPGGRKIKNPRLLGLALDDERLMVVYSQNDLLGAMSRDLYGSWEFVVEPGGARQREASFRLGINLVFYGLCLDYKNDRVHLPHILKRRRL
jgi:hypothetical protein